MLTKRAPRGTSRRTPRYPARTRLTASVIEPCAGPRTAHGEDRQRWCIAWLSWWLRCRLSGWPAAWRKRARPINASRPASFSNNDATIRARGFRNATRTFESAGTVASEPAGRSGDSDVAGERKRSRETQPGAPPCRSRTRQNEQRMQSRPFRFRDPDRPEPGIRGTPGLRQVHEELHRGFRGMCCPTGKIITRRSVFSSSMQARVRCLRTQLPLIPKRPSRCHAC